MLIKQSRLPIRQMITVGLLPSRWKVAWYRSRGAKIGQGVTVLDEVLKVAQRQLPVQCPAPVCHRWIALLVFQFFAQLRGRHSQILFVPPSLIPVIDQAQHYERSSHL